MRALIKDAILEMRANKITITKKALAEELGVSVRTLYADYIAEFLQNFPEFNPSVQSVVPSRELELIKNENAGLKEKMKTLAAKNRSLKLELIAVKQKLNESEAKYEHLLGQYQIEVGNKIIHF